MIRIDEPIVPSRTVWELRSATDRYTSRFQRRRRIRAAGLGATLLAAALAVLGSGATGRSIDVHTIRPAAPDARDEQGAVVPRSVEGGDRSVVVEAMPRRPASQGEGSPAPAPSGRAGGSPSPHPRSHTKLLFVRQSTGRLMELSLDDGAVRQVLPTAFEGRWSPDGRRIILETGTGLALYDVPSGERTVLFEDEVLEREPSYRPVWLPDGSSVVFQQTRKTGLSTWSTELWVLDTRTRATRRLGPGSEPSVDRAGRILHRCDYEWCLTDVSGADLGVLPNTVDLADAVLSPDGRRLAAHRPGSPTTLVVQQLDGRERHIVVTGRSGGRPAWFPDGSQLAFAPPSTHSLEPHEADGIFSVRLDGSGLRRLTDGDSDTAPDLVHVS